MKYKVIIIEDDPMVASINKQYVERNNQLELIGIFSNGIDGLKYLEDHSADLIILDMYMPLMDGKEFLNQLRASQNPIDVIMVTAATDISNIRSLFSYGLVDYLVKPFEYSRFATALKKFIQKQELMAHNRDLTQQNVDELLSFAQSNPSPEKEVLPSKGLQSKTLDSIRAYLDQHIGEGLTSEQIADEVGLSRVTIRRYMNYMIEQKEVSSDIDYNTGGRPSIIYHYERKLPFDIR